MVQKWSFGHLVICQNRNQTPPQFRPQYNKNIFLLYCEQWQSIKNENDQMTFWPNDHIFVPIKFGGVDKNTLSLQIIKNPKQAWISRKYDSRQSLNRCVTYSCQAVTCFRGGKSKRFTFPLYPVKLTYDFTPVATASGGMSCVQPYLI